MSGTDEPRGGAGVSSRVARVIAVVLSLLIAAAAFLGVVARWGVNSDKASMILLGALALTTASYNLFGRRPQQSTIETVAFGVQAGLGLTILLLQVV